MSSRDFVSAVSLCGTCTSSRGDRNSSEPDSIASASLSPKTGKTETLPTAEGTLSVFASDLDAPASSPQLGFGNPTVSESASFFCTSRVALSSPRTELPFGDAALVAGCTRPNEARLASRRVGPAPPRGEPHLPQNCSSPINSWPHLRQTEASRTSAPAGTPVPPSFASLADSCSDNVVKFGFSFSSASSILARSTAKDFFHVSSESRANTSVTRPAMSWQV